MSVRLPGSPRIGPRPTLSVVFVVLVLPLTGLLAYNAFASARSHRATAENTLRDYAGVAAWEYARRAREMLSGVMSEALAPARLVRASHRSQLPETDLLRHAIERDCRCPNSIKSAHTYFRVNLMEPDVDVISDRPDFRIRDWIQDTIAAHLQDRENLRWQLFIVDDERDAIGAYWVVRDGGGHGRAAYGFVTDLDVVAELFAVSCSRVDLIPPALAGDQPTDSLVYLALQTSKEGTVFDTPVGYETLFSARDTLGAAYGGLTILAAIRPDAADELVIGGLPASRLPLIMVLLVLTLGVGLAALTQVRREQQLARLRDDFVSGVSHELRTPLAQIRMFGELLDDGRLRNAEERKRSVSVISREARRLTHLVENILHFSRLRRSAVRLAPEVVPVRHLLGETVEGFAPLARQRDVHIRESIAESFDITGDRGALSQILLNLLDNALKYGPEGQTVTVGAERLGETARLWVEDEGPGIPPSQLQQIWEPYKRLERDANTTVVGSGIGLSVVLELVDLHGGRVWAENGTVGARFVIEVPGAAPAADPVAATPAAGTPA